ncbi:unnamed protein product [Rotaria socialis]|uniref:Rhamnogalacturonase A/B/Epimerase-like pectate lyase domain-containing protein n=1 Tax=Rotaria socialis TaxID=392032 RepID=A0A820PGV7_9BILA|nr:unnamed protein product [Rotaria socialis]CAF3286030.1 unnamed protein product [Rotaria socialis]CAF3385915.1 unnamed protein product [Rotaria socialis]CAF3481210.1 unnamed protein product [Rotaria socialis]CAF4404684.1 unnamed protein product [Rotaria socialis]
MVNINVVLLVVLLTNFHVVYSTIFNIRDYGAVGDGVTDDTRAIIETIDKCMESGGVLYIPTGKFVVRSSLIFKTNFKFTITGDGIGSVLSWEFDDHLIVILSQDGSESSQLTIRDFSITSSVVLKSLDKFAIYAEDLVQSQIEHLVINSNDSKSFPVPSGIGMMGVADTNTIRDVVMWEIKGTGIQIGYGSEIRILGGRIIGAGIRFDSSIGIHCTGNNGGVHIENTDIIALGTGILIANSSGVGSNREIFISHATIDSNGRGLVIRDNSYVSIIGIWAASSTIDQVFIDENTTAVLSISGGTIFNGGVYECPKESDWCNGLTVRSGTFILNGVEVRNNNGRGIWIPNKSVTQYQIIACRIFANGQGFNVTGSSFMITNNICNSNQIPNAISGTETSIVLNNLGC